VNEADLVELVRQALLAGLVIIAPVLLAGFVVATVTGLVQAATGIHEPLVALVPRLAVMGAALVLVAPWMVERCADLLRAAAAPW
jgi:flagellar biosynthetic protein FliQ